MGTGHHSAAAHISIGTLNLSMAPYSLNFRDQNTVAELDPEHLSSGRASKEPSSQVSSPQKKHHPRSRTYCLEAAILFDYRHAVETEFDEASSLDQILTFPENTNEPIA